MRFLDFVALEIVIFCQLTEVEVFALHYYTTAGYKGINWPLGDQERRAQRLPHQVAVHVFTLAKAIKKLRAWTANADIAHQEVDTFRGMGDRKILDTFMEEGRGTDSAFMSALPTSGLPYSKSRDRGDDLETLLWLRTTSLLLRGAPLEWLSAFPHEREIVFLLLANLQPTGRAVEAAPPTKSLRPN